jgi:DNA-binding transcriptional LysR family regulator
LWPPSHRAVEVEPAYLAVPFLEDPRKWAIMPQSMGLSLMDSDGCLVHELTDPPPARTLYMVHRRRLTPHARRAIELFIDTCESVISEAKAPYTR